MPLDIYAALGALVRAQATRDADGTAIDAASPSAGTQDIRLADTRRTDPGEVTTEGAGNRDVPGGVQ